MVYTGELVVRGNATVINHGWGIYTGYMHRSEILVNVGDRVETGQLIGLVGNTGRVHRSPFAFRGLGWRGAGRSPGMDGAGVPLISLRLNYLIIFLVS